jgi:hypothetical protein
MNCNKLFKTLLKNLESLITVVLLNLSTIQTGYTSTACSFLAESVFDYSDVESSDLDSLFGSAMPFMRSSTAELPSSVIIDFDDFEALEIVNPSKWWDGEPEEQFPGTKDIKLPKTITLENCLKLAIALDALQINAINGKPIGDKEAYYRKAAEYYELTISKYNLVLGQEDFLENVLVAYNNLGVLMNEGVYKKNISGKSISSADALAKAEYEFYRYAESNSRRKACYQYNIGLMYMNGRIRLSLQRDATEELSLPACYQTAYGYLKEIDHPCAQYCVAQLIEKVHIHQHKAIEITSDNRYQLAFDLYKKSKTSDAFCGIGWLIERGYININLKGNKIEPKDRYDEAARLYQASRTPASFFRLAELLKHDYLHLTSKRAITPERRNAMIAQFYTKSAAKGHQYAQYKLARFIQKGYSNLKPDGTEITSDAERYTIISNLYQLSNVPKSFSRLGELIQSGLWSSPSKDKMITTHGKAAENYRKSDTDQARINLGVLFAQGHLKNFNSKKITTEIERCKTFSKIVAENQDTEKTLYKVAFLIETGVIQCDLEGAIFPESERFNVCAQMYQLSATRKSLSRLAQLILADKYITSPENILTVATMIGEYLSECGAACQQEVHKIIYDLCYKHNTCESYVYLVQTTNAIVKESLEKDRQILNIYSSMIAVTESEDPEKAAMIKKQASLLAAKIKQAEGEASLDSKAPSKPKGRKAVTQIKEPAYAVHLRKTKAATVPALEDHMDEHHTILPQEEAELRFSKFMESRQPTTLEVTRLQDAHLAYNIQNALKTITIHQFTVSLLLQNKIESTFEPSYTRGQKVVSMSKKSDSKDDAGAKPQKKIIIHEKSTGVFEDYKEKCEAHLVLPQFKTFINTLRTNGLQGFQNGKIKKIEVAFHGESNAYEFRLNREYRVYFTLNDDGSFTLLKGFYHL